MHEVINQFFKSNKIATICCVTRDAEPYCFNCFYAFDEPRSLLLFKSSDNSFHSKILENGGKISGTILPANIKLSSIKGMQFSGVVVPNSSSIGVEPEAIYHRTHPLAIMRPGNVWCIQLQKAKMTDNTRIFADKLVWERDAEVDNVML